MKGIATLPKNVLEEIRVTIDEFHCLQLLNMRVWYRSDDGMRPSKKGLAMRLAQLPELLEALTAAETYREQVEKGGRT